MTIPTNAARRYGGHVKISVIVLLYPRVSITEGRKFWKPTEERCRLYMRHRAHVRQSVADSRRPTHTLVFSRTSVVSV